MPKLLIITTLLIIFSGLSTAVDAEISQECEADQEPLISMSSPSEDYNHPGPPDFYDNNVCVTGVTETEITEDDCVQNAGFYVSSTDEDAHFSFEPGFNKNVCTAEMSTTLNETCDDSEPLFSVSSENDAHVAEPEVFDLQVCGFIEPPENVSVSMDFNLSDSDTAYFEGEEVDGEETFSPPSAYPYLVLESENHLAGVMSRSFNFADRELTDTNRLEISDSDSSRFLIPFFEGDRQDLEAKRDEFTEGQLLSQVNPGFTTSPAGESSTRVVLDPETNMKSDIPVLEGRQTFRVVKTGENEVTVEDQ